MMARSSSLSHGRSSSQKLTKGAPFALPLSYLHSARHLCSPPAETESTAHSLPSMHFCITTPPPPSPSSLWSIETFARRIASNMRRACSSLSALPTSTLAWPLLCEVCKGRSWRKMRRAWQGDRRAS